MEFPKVSRSSLYSIVMYEHLGYIKHKNSLAATFYEVGIGVACSQVRQMPLNRQGDYVEK